jgi:hypothetical protein
MSKKAGKVKLKLFLLRPVAEWKPWYDKCNGAVVRTTSEEEARKAMSQVSGDEGVDVWLDPKLTTCVELSADGPPEMVISDFSAA